MRKRTGGRRLVYAVVALALLGVGALTGVLIGNLGDESSSGSAAPGSEGAVPTVAVGASPPDQTDVAAGATTPATAGETTSDEPTSDAGDDAAADDAAADTTRTGPAAPGTTIPAVPGVFTEAFDGAPSAPQPWTPAAWDVTVHSRDVNTWDELEGMEAHHSPDCGTPGSMGTNTHSMNGYDQAVFQCKDHVMTSLNASGYGVIYLTPNQQVDFSGGTATIRFDMSTLRTSGRDWWDVWITPYAENLQLPLEESFPDLSGPPQNALQVRVDATNVVFAEIFRDFKAVEFSGFPVEHVSPAAMETYDTFLVQDAARRDTFEIQISATHLKVGMPAYDFWWIDTDIPELAFTSGIVQFGHHSYNPTKDCDVANPSGPDGTCKPNTWHWDNVSIDPAVPFTMIKPEQRMATPEADTVVFASAAPPEAYLRFAAAGSQIEVSYDGGDWQPAELQAALKPFKDETFNSYWTPVPAGTTEVRFRGADWYGGPWRARDITIWAGGIAAG